VIRSSTREISAPFTSAARLLRCWVKLLIDSSRSKRKINTMMPTIHLGDHALCIFPHFLAAIFAPKKTVCGRAPFWLAAWIARRIMACLTILCSGYE